MRARSTTDLPVSETCEADVAYPPGWYPVEENGTTSYSKFAQRYTGTLTDGSVYTVGDTVTPPAPFFTPASSNCVTTSTIANNIALESLGITPGASAPSSQATGGSSGTGHNSAGTATRTGTSAGAKATGTGSANAAVGLKGSLSLIALTVVAGFLFH